MSQQIVDDPLAAAKEAAEKHLWQEAFDCLAALDAEGALDGAGIEMLAEMAWWTQQPDLSTATRERAYAAYMAEGDRVRAAFMALLAARDHIDHQSEALGRGWWARASRILSEEPESFAHGYLTMFESMQAGEMGDFDRAAELAHRAVEMGAKYGDKDLQAFGLVSEGSALIRRGDIDEGLLLLDEATAAAVAGELSPFTTGVIYCHTISTCRDLTDYRRAGQWTEVAKRWCERQSINGFPGVCRVHRAEIMALRGDWTDAEDEARRAAGELLAFKANYQAGEGYYTLGEIRLRLGDLVGADEAFRQAQDLGKDPQPGRALLYLAQGRLEAAQGSIERALTGAAADRLTRARLLPAQVDILLAAGDVAGARVAATELSAIAEAFGSAALRAAAHCAMGAVHVAAGEPDPALREFSQSRAHWQAVDAPYEMARSRTMVASALRLRGEVEEAEIELEAAEAAFARLGATIDAARVARTLEDLRGHADQGERQRRTFMFTDIVGSTELIAVIGDEAWGDVVRWHDQTLRGLASRHGGEEVNHAGDGFFFAFRDVRSAVACAAEIQRVLTEHRRNAGFAPRVRIGLHAAEATKVEEGYLGQGVHQAARIGAIAGAGEIVASAETLAGEVIPEATLSAPWAVELKGIPGMVQVQNISWS